MKKFEGIELKLCEPRKNVFVIESEGDLNDGDYIESSNILNEEDFLKVLPILKKIENYNGRHNWEEAKSYLSDSEIEIVNYQFELIPSGEYDVHTVGFSIVYIDENSATFNVKIL